MPSTARVAVRNVRRDGMEALKKAEKDDKISQDEHRQKSDEVQKLTDGYVKQVDEALAHKEKEIMTGLMSTASLPANRGPVAGVPHHVAIIMDGNGRWAKARGLPRIAGHRRGAEAVRARRARRRRARHSGI